jgi:hypothetical protein
MHNCTLTLVLLSALQDDVSCKNFSYLIQKIRKPFAYLRKKNIRFDLENACLQDIFLSSFFDLSCHVNRTANLRSV